MKIIRSFFILFLLMFFQFFAFSEELNIDESTEELSSIEEHFHVLIDHENDLSIKEIMKEEMEFVPFEKKYSIIETGKTVWLKFFVKNYRKSSVEWIVNFYDPDYTLIELYDLGKVYTSGTQFPFTQKRFFHKNYIFPIHLEPGEFKVFYVKLRSETGSIIKANLTSIEKHQAYALSEYYILGIYYGVLFILCIYNFILFFHTRFTTYLFYVAYLMCSILFSFKEDGLGFQFFWSQFPFFNQVIDFFAPVLLLISFIGFATSFLEVDKKSKEYKILFMVMVIALISQVMYYLRLFPEQLSFFFYLLPFINLFYIARNKLKEKHSDSVYFMIGNSLIFGSMVVYFLRLNSWVDSGIFEVYVFNFSVIIEAVVLSIAVANKIKRGINNQEVIKEELIESLKEKELLSTKVNRELEYKVTERTLQLEKQKDKLKHNNTELLTLKEKLYAMNEALDLANFKLKNEVKTYSRERILNKEVPFEEFNLLYGNTIACKNYLKNLKDERGFRCRKCDKTEYLLINVSSRKCVSCKHLESVTANTIFHSLKFPLPKAFYLVYITNYDQRKFTLDQLSALLDLGRNTCWSFTKKVQEKKLKLSHDGVVQVSFDELIYG